MGLLQILVGVAIGLVALVFLTQYTCHQPLENQERRRSGRNESRSRASGYKAKIGDICVICLSEMNEIDIYFLTCKHALHTYCYNLYKRSNGDRCPVCRKADTGSS